MKIIKSNRNYKLYNSGFHWIIECDDNVNSPVKFYEIVKACEQMYGPEREWKRQRDDKAWTIMVYNHNWRYDINKKLKRRRIYLKNETDITLLMLKAQ